LYIWLSKDIECSFDNLFIYLYLSPDGFHDFEERGTRWQGPKYDDNCDRGFLFDFLGPRLLIQVHKKCQVHQKKRYWLNLCGEEIMRGVSFVSGNDTLAPSFSPLTSAPTLDRTLDLTT
jgi:hypothetical protein